MMIRPVLFPGINQIRLPGSGIELAELIQVTVCRSIDDSSGFDLQRVLSASFIDNDIHFRSPRFPIMGKRWNLATVQIKLHHFRYNHGLKEISPQRVRDQIFGIADL
jgi:hypothetical protein